MKKEENKNKETTKSDFNNSCSESYSSCKCLDENKNSTIKKSAEGLATDPNVFDLSKEGTEVKTKVFYFFT